MRFGSDSRDPSEDSPWMGREGTAWTFGRALLAAKTDSLGSSNWEIAGFESASPHHRHSKEPHWSVFAGGNHFCC